MFPLFGQEEMNAMTSVAPLKTNLYSFINKPGYWGEKKSKLFPVSKEIQKIQNSKEKH